MWGLVFWFFFLIIFLQILVKNRNTYRLPKHHSRTVSKRIVKASSGIYWLQRRSWLNKTEHQNKAMKVICKPSNFPLKEGGVSPKCDYDVVFMCHWQRWLTFGIQCPALLWFQYGTFLMQIHRTSLKLHHETLCFIAV